MGKTAQRKLSAFQLGVEHAKKYGRGFSSPRNRGPVHLSYLAGVKSVLAGRGPSYSPDYADGAGYCRADGFELGPLILKALAVAGLLIWASLAFMASGCSSIHVITPDGYSASYTRIGDQEISGLRFEKDATGLTRIILDKQASKSDVVLNALRALVEGAK